MVVTNTTRHIQVLHSWPSCLENSSEMKCSRTTLTCVPSYQGGTFNPPHLFPSPLPQDQSYKALNTPLKQIRWALKSVYKRVMLKGELTSMVWWVAFSWLHLSRIPASWPIFPFCKRVIMAGEFGPSPSPPPSPPIPLGKGLSTFKHPILGPPPLDKRPPPIFLVNSPSKHFRWVQTYFWKPQKI